MTKKKLVTTIDGSEHPKVNCRYIKNNYYLIGDPKIKNSGQCYLVNNKYYRVESGYIEYDHGIAKYVLKTNSLIKGIIEIKEDGETPVLGYFSKNPVHNVNLVSKNGTVYTVLIKDVLFNTKYREKIYDGNFYHIDNIKAKNFYNKRYNLSGYKYNLPYNSADSLLIHSKYYKEYNDSVISEQLLKNFKHVPKGYTYGLEFETTVGIIPDRINKKLGLIPLRDGSISGIEYVTVPLSGAKGFQTIIDSCKELNKRTNIDETCSLHLHIGGIPRTISYITALFKTMCYIQDEMYRMFPLYKWKNCGVKKKSYTRELPILQVLTKMDYRITEDNLIDNFEHIFQYLSMGQNYKSNYNSLEEVEEHPSDPEGQSKWYIKSRYHWINFIPLLFGNKKTVEFRLHTPTYDSDKILNFITICTFVLDFVKKYETNILQSRIGLDLENILFLSEHNYDFSDRLNKYIRNRRVIISEQFRSGNIYSDEKSIESNINWSKEPEKRSFKKIKIPSWILEHTYYSPNNEITPIPPPEPHVSIMNEINEILEPNNEG